LWRCCGLACKGLASLAKRNRNTPRHFRSETREKHWPNFVVPENINALHRRDPNPSGNSN